MNGCRSRFVSDRDWPAGLTGSILERAHVSPCSAQGSPQDPSRHQTVASMVCTFCCDSHHVDRCGKPEAKNHSESFVVYSARDLTVTTTRDTTSLAILIRSDPCLSGASASLVLPTCAISSCTRRRRLLCLREAIPARLSIPSGDGQMRRSFILLMCCASCSLSVLSIADVELFAHDQQFPDSTHKGRCCSSTLICERVFAGRRADNCRTPSTASRKQGCPLGDSSRILNGEPG